MKCPVCGNNTFGDSIYEYEYEYEICPECYWEYDITQVNEVNYDVGANGGLSLSEYRKRYWRLKEENENFSCTNDDDRKKMLKGDGKRDFIFDRDIPEKTGKMEPLCVINADRLLTAWKDDGKKEWKLHSYPIMPDGSVLVNFSAKNKKGMECCCTFGDNRKRSRADTSL